MPGDGNSGLWTRSIVFMTNVSSLKKNRGWPTPLRQMLMTSPVQQNAKSLLDYKIQKLNKEESVANKSAIAIFTRKRPNKTNRPSKEAVLTSLDERILYIVVGTSYFAIGLQIYPFITETAPVALIHLQQST